MTAWIVTAVLLCGTEGIPIRFTTHAGRTDALAVARRLIGIRYTDSKGRQCDVSQVSITEVEKK